MLARLQRRTLAFCALTAAILATAMALSSGLGAADDPGPLAVGITLDLTVIVPIAFYLLVVRPRGWPPVAMAPVIVLCLLAASAVLPHDQQGPLEVVKALAIPVEIGLLVWVVWHAGRALRHASGSGGVDAVEALHRSAGEILRARRPGDVLASELAVLFFATAAWRREPHVPAGMRVFTTHRRTGQGGLVLALLMVTVVEVVAVHFLVANWSPVAAWVITLASVYGAVWLVADFRATVLRPVLADGDLLWLRAGLRWRARVPRARIVRVERGAPRPEAGVMPLSLMTSPNVWVEFAEPVVLDGPYGVRRETRAVSLAVDDPAEFQRLLTPA
jgi:hypothetical protein